MNQRPTGVTILAILAFVGGILSILAGLALVGLGGLFAALGLGPLAFVFGIYGIVWGALALWIGYGFWQLRPSSWRWGIILMTVGIVVTIVEVPLGYSGGGLSWVISVAIYAVVIYYLLTPGVRAAFGQPTGGAMQDVFMGAFGMGGGGGAAMSAPPPAPPAEPPASTWSQPSEPAASSWTPPAQTGGMGSEGGGDDDEGASA